MEVSDVRRRLRSAIDETRRRVDERRVRRDEASRAWERALTDVATPAFHQLASALTAEGYRFKVVTPGATVRLVPERGGDEFVELALDSEGDEPVVMIRSTWGRGRRTVTRERPLGAVAFVDDRIVDQVIEELKHFLER
jgi:hypothetical protein